ncbi:MAG TPA: sigma-70 family RNA polymerase sigma factor [Planctomycetota bacterium]|nr:sigma-70 family RNA polymerase sigma factor [Planctomycetota bacterium]
MADFPATTWGMLRGFQDADVATRKDAMEKLCRRYWRPIHDYARAAWARDDEDASDLTQDFFLWLFGGTAVDGYVADRGAFRHYLKGLLRNFGRRRGRDLRRKKRGGGRAAVPLDDAIPEATEPEEALDRAWRKEIMIRAVERLRARHAEEAPLRWKIFEEYDLRPEGAPELTYAQVAERLGVKENDVRNHLHALRAKLREAMRAEVRETVATEEDLEEEWRALVGA